MIFRMKRRLGLGEAPTVGMQFAESGVYLALVRSHPLAVVGLGHVPLPTGTIVDGQVRRPTEAGPAVEAALSSVHWHHQPSLRATVQPEPLSGSSVHAEVGVVAAVVRDTTSDTPAAADGGTGHHSDDGDAEVGIVSARKQTVSSVAVAMQWVTGAVRSIEPTPVSVARFLRAAQPGQPLRFARLSTPQRMWTLCDGAGRFEVEVVRQPGALTALIDGPDQTRLTSTEWGRISVNRSVKSTVTQPNLFAPAVGAALGEHLPGLTGDLLGAGSTAATNVEPFGRWTVESVR